MAKAFNKILEKSKRLNRPLDDNDIKNIHRIIVRGLDDDNAGMYRGVPLSFRRERGAMMWGHIGWVKRAFEEYSTKGMDYFVSEDAKSAIATISIGEIPMVCQKSDCLIVAAKSVKADGVKGTANNRSQRRNMCDTGGQIRWKRTQ